MTAADQPVDRGVELFLLRTSLIALGAVVATGASATAVLLGWRAASATNRRRGRA